MDLYYTFIVSIMTCLARMFSIRTEVYLINRPEAKPRDIKDIPINTTHPS